MNHFLKLLFAFILSIILSLIFTKLQIHYSKKKNLKQQIREDIVSTHKKKKNTPTMGGISFILATLISYIIFDFESLNSSRTQTILLVFLGFGIIGLIDDLTKIHFKNSKGISGNLRLALELILTISALLLLGYNAFNLDNSFIHIPLANIDIMVGSMFVPYIIFVILGTSNAVNFTDGLDGLAGGLMIAALTPFLMIAIKNYDYSIALLMMCIIGSLLGFLRYNIAPAKIFMGDTGSLALGGLLGICAILLKSEILILVAGILFFIEIISIILQIGFFKATKGKRIFKMAPIHHHFEKDGKTEWKIVMVFWIIGFAFSTLATLIGVM